MKFTLFLLAVVPFVLSCDKALLGEDEPIISLEENLQPPTLLDDGWDVSTLADQNIQEAPIQQLIKKLQENSGNIHSLIIVRNNKLVSESYFDGWHRERLHATRSASKSFVSTIAGIAIDKGYINDVDQKLFDYFPEYADVNNEQKSEIKLKHVLTMTSGLAWDEKTYSGLDYRNDEYALERSNDRLRYILGKKMVTQPGDHFVYNSGGPFLMMTIINKTTGNFYDFADENFFKPLNIKNYYWRIQPDGLIAAIGPILLTPRDMAKLGQLFLNGGKWKDKQIVSSEWVDAASATFIGNEENATGYGYNWWVANYYVNNNPVRVYFARGKGGQYIFVISDLNAVVVFTSGNYEGNQNAPYAMLKNIIMPAME